MAACCDAGPSKPHSHASKGEVVTVGDTHFYVVGHGTRGIVLTYDIFGFDVPQTRANCDDFAAAGFMVCMPDHFRNKPWKLENFPPPDGKVFKAWISEHSWETGVKQDCEKAVEILRSRGCKTFGHVGYCWGGRTSMKAAAMNPPVFSAVAAVHPAFISDDDIVASNVPVLLLPSKDEPDYVPAFEKLRKKPFGAKCGYHRFEKDTHGFAAARGNRSDPHVAASARDAVSRIVRHFEASL